MMLHHRRHHNRLFLALVVLFVFPLGTIVTDSQRDTLDFAPRRIEILPFWQWVSTLA